MLSSAVSLSVLSYRKGCIKKIGFVWIGWFGTGGDGGVDVPSKSFPR